MTGEHTPFSSFTPPPLPNVLVVDDTQANRQAFEALLETQGYAVFLADSGQAALALADMIHFAVILLDVRMPVLTGLETAVLLRKKPLTRSTPIVFVSAYEETQLEVSRSELTGLEDFIFSPVDSEILAWKVKKWVEFFIRQELHKREVARMATAYADLHEILLKNPIAETALKETHLRLATAVRSLIESLHERLAMTGGSKRRSAIHSPREDGRTGRTQAPFRKKDREGYLDSR